MIKKIILIILFLFLSCSIYAAVKPAMTSFNAGEISPLLLMRSDFNKYDNSCQKLQNMLPLSQGPVTRRPGTMYIADVKYATQTIRLIPFEYAKTDAYILEFGDLYIRFYRDGGQIQGLTGTETLTGPPDITGDRVAQWKLNDNAATTTVVEDVGTHTGTATVNTSLLHVTGKVGTGAFDLSNDNYITVADHANFTFALKPFSISAWIYAYPDISGREIISKYDQNSKREWQLTLTVSEKIRLSFYDETEDEHSWCEIDTSLTGGWYFIVATYDGRGGATAADGIKIYINGEYTDSNVLNNADYVSMRNTSAPVLIGASKDATSTVYRFYNEKLDNVCVFNTELTAAQIEASFYSSAVYEVTTTYVEEDLFELQYVQSADVMYIVHPLYPPRKLSRADHDDWTIADVDFSTGPFMDENTIATMTITPSIATGTIVLTATSTLFEPEHEGSIWEIRHPRDDATLSGTFASASSTSAIDCEGDYKLTTHGTWTASVMLERSKDSGATWETVSGSFISSVDDDNIDYAGSEDEAGYQYRVTLKDFTSGDCTFNFIVYDHMHTGVVRITDYISSTQATASVITALGTITATPYWSEGYWSEENGYPETIEFHQFRLWYGGSTAYPQTLWASQVEDYDNMTEGTDDNDALIYMLPGQNPIQWLLSHTYLMIGTLGGAGRMGEEGESMAPGIQPQYLQQSGYGSKYIQAKMAGDAILYIERGGTKIREFVYSFERDRFVSPDMTVLAEHITGDGIVDIAYQSKPDSTLWCVREDGNLPSMTYNRSQEVVAWAEHVTDGDVESVAVIPGTDEDEVWISVERTIGTSTVRYIEQLQPRDWGDDQDDCFFVDSGLTWDGGVSVSIGTITQATPCVIHVTSWPVDGDGVNLADDDQIKIESVLGMTELNGNIYTVDDASAASLTFSLNNSANTDNIDSTSYTAHTSGGTVQRFENTFSGFGHLESETVSILADGVVQNNQVVHGNGFTITTWSNKIHAGLPYTSILHTMPIVFEGREGSVAGSKKQVSHVALNFFESLGTLYGVEDDTDEVFTESELFSGWKYLSFQHGYTREASIYLEQVDPLPLTVRAIIPTVTVTE